MSSNNKICARCGCSIQEDKGEVFHSSSIKEDKAVDVLLCKKCYTDLYGNFLRINDTSGNKPTPKKVKYVYAILAIIIATCFISAFLKVSYAPYLMMVTLVSTIFAMYLVLKYNNIEKITYTARNTTAWIILGLYLVYVAIKYSE